MFDDFKEDVENGSFTGFAYADTWNYEDEYSHNDIAIARKQFIEMANDFSMKDIWVI